MLLACNTSNDNPRNPLSSKQYPTYNLAGHCTPPRPHRGTHCRQQRTFPSPAQKPVELPDQVCISPGSLPAALSMATYAGLSQTAISTFHQHRTIGAYHHQIWSDSSNEEPPGVAIQGLLGQQQQQQGNRASPCSMSSELTDPTHSNQPPRHERDTPLHV